MKVTKILIAMLASAFIVTACDPIEDEDLRDKYVTDAGTPITKEALQAAISITQPFPNQDGVVEGDQYIALKNSRPDNSQPGSVPVQYHLADAILLIR